MTQKIVDPVYLGDAVYASFDGYHIWLHLDSHRENDKVIALDSHVLDALALYRNRCAKQSTS